MTSTKKRTGASPRGDTSGNRRPRLAKQRVNLRVDPSLLAQLDEFCAENEVDRTWAMEQSVRLMLDMVSARKHGCRIVVQKPNKRVAREVQLYSVDY